MSRATPSEICPAHGLPMTGEAFSDANGCRLERDGDTDVRGEERRRVERVGGEN